MNRFIKSFLSVLVIISFFSSDYSTFAGYERPPVPSELSSNIITSANNIFDTIYNKKNNLNKYPTDQSYIDYLNRITISLNNLKNTFSSTDLKYIIITYLNSWINNIRLSVQNDNNFLDSLSDIINDNNSETQTNSNNQTINDNNTNENITSSGSNEKTFNNPKRIGLPLRATTVTRDKFCKEEWFEYWVITGTWTADTTWGNWTSEWSANWRLTFNTSWIKSIKCTDIGTGSTTNTANACSYEAKYTSYNNSDCSWVSSSATVSWWNKITDYSLIKWMSDYSKKGYWCQVLWSNLSRKWEMISTNGKCIIDEAIVNKQITTEQNELKEKEEAKLAEEQKKILDEQKRIQEAQKFSFIASKTSNLRKWDTVILKWNVWTFYTKCMLTWGNYASKPLVKTWSNGWMSISSFYNNTVNLTWEYKYTISSSTAYITFELRCVNWTNWLTDSPNIKSVDLKWNDI